MSQVMCCSGHVKRPECSDAHSEEHFVAVDEEGRAVTLFHSWYSSAEYPTDDEIREAFESTPPVTP